MSYVTITTDTDSDEHFKDHDYIVFNIDKKEVDSGRTGKSVSRLMLLSDKKAWAEKFNGKVILSFTGYDADSRELHEIPEVVRFFREIDQQWAFWLHYIVRSPDAYAVIAFLQNDVTVVRRGKQVGCQLVDTKQVDANIYRMKLAVEQLHSAFEFSPLVSGQTKLEINQTLDALLGG